MLLSIERMLILKSAQIFAGVSDEILAELASQMEEVMVRAGDTIMNQGEKGRSIYVIVSGAVSVTRDGQRLASLGPGEVVGELAAFDPGPRSATVRAEEDTHLLELENDQVESMMMYDVEMLRAVTRMLCRRLRAVETPFATPSPAATAGDLGDGSR